MSYLKEDKSAPSMVDNWFTSRNPIVPGAFYTKKSLRAINLECTVVSLRPLFFAEGIESIYKKAVRD